MITGNSAGRGGGIYSTAQLAINNSTITGNTAPGTRVEASIQPALDVTRQHHQQQHRQPVDGGGLAVAGGTATLTGVAITGQCRAP